METLHQPSRPSRRRLSHETTHLLGDLLPIGDLAAALLAAHVAMAAIAGGLPSSVTAAALLERIAPMALAGALLVPFILRDRAFVSLAASGRDGTMLGRYLMRFLLFAGVVGAVGIIGLVPAGLPPLWLGLWCAAILLITASSRLLLAAVLHMLAQRGLLSEVIAIVGAGADADRLIASLRQDQRRRVEILGVFDDDVLPGDACGNRPVGSIAELLELGKSQPMDWILLARPELAADEPQSVVRRLKVLSTPIALWIQDGSAPAGSPLPDGIGPRADGWSPMRAMSARWMAALVPGLQGAGRGLLATMPGRRANGHPARERAGLTLVLDDYDLDGLADVAARFGQTRYGYLVTPNADHVIRLHHDAGFRQFYADAAYTVLDSHFMARWLRFVRDLRLPVCTGSDLTARLFADVIAPDDTIVLIGGDARQAEQLRTRFNLTRLFHLNPPMGFIHDPGALEACLQFVESHSPFRFCLLAVGAPRQEQVAHLLQARGNARGLALCVGAAINFLTGTERRAPRWMRRSGLEWLFRLLQNPGRMAGRYLLRGPRLFAVLRRTDILLRRRPATVELVAAGVAGESSGQFTVLAPALAQAPEAEIPLVVRVDTLAGSQ